MSICSLLCTRCSLSSSCSVRTRWLCTEESGEREHSSACAMWPSSWRSRNRSDSPSSSAAAFLTAGCGPSFSAFALSMMWQAVLSARLSGRHSRRSA